METAGASKGKWLFVIGLVLTALWVLVPLVILVYEAGWNFRSMRASEWGDFLSGIAAPPALMWLIVGYFQHGKEIELQQKELRHQIEETSRIVQHTKQQAEAATDLLRLEDSREAREARPEFIRDGERDLPSDGSIVIYLRNRGGEARDAKFLYEGPRFFECNLPNRIDTNQRVALIFRTAGAETAEWPLQFEITCTDRLGHRHSMMFTVEQGLHIEEVTQTVKAPRLFKA